MVLHDWLDYWGRERPAAEFALFEGNRLSYGDALDQANRLANALAGSGLAKGDRFAFLSKNSLEYSILYFAASKAGVVPVPLNYRLAPPEWEFIVNDSESKLLIASGEFVEAADGVRERLAAVSAFISTGSRSHAGWSSYDSWLAKASSSPPDRVVLPSDHAAQMYTSGTTGRPKGAILTHGSIVANVQQLTTPLSGLWRGRQLLVAPYYHIASTICACYAACHGNSLFIQADFVPENVVRALDEEGISGAVLVPAMIQACLVAVPDVASRRYERLRLLGYAASPISEATLRRAMEVFRCSFAQSYGLTESSGVLTMLTDDDHRLAASEQPGLLVSAGRPVLGTEVQVVDASGNSVAPGCAGEIVARGPQLMEGYWNRPDATAETLRDGWLHTGDIGYADDRGYVFIQDRLNDMICSGGENIYPREVEDVLFQHGAVADTAVIGVPDRQWGESLKAFVVRRAGHSVSEQDLIDFCRTRLGAFKVPRSIEWVDSMPRNPSGKVLKRELRERYWKGQTRRVSGA